MCRTYKQSQRVWVEGGGAVALELPRDLGLLMLPGHRGTSLSWVLGWQGQDPVSPTPPYRV